MRISLPLALAESGVVAFNQPQPAHLAHALQDAIDLSQEDDLSTTRRLRGGWNRRLQGGKYEEKYYQKCGSVGISCGKVVGAIAATPGALIPRRKKDGLSYGRRVKTTVQNGAWTGEAIGGEAAGYLGEKVGKLKDKLIAKKAAKGRRGRR
ncbi:unnamed protein product [Aphanomyces euteiches]